MTTPRKRWPRRCVHCRCPLARMWIPGEGERERRAVCARCVKADLANPCAVRDCVGKVVEVVSRVSLCASCVDVARELRRARVVCRCGECRRCKDRALVDAWRRAHPDKMAEFNRRAYVTNKSAIAARHAAKRSGPDGDRVRERERARYAASKGGAVRVYRKRGPNHAE